MAFEIDFLPVGAGKKSGDAIALRYGNLSGPRSAQTVVVIDGGTKESGRQLAHLVRTTYGTDTIDFVISTHPDTDHTSGLTEVLSVMKVGTLLMHLPWQHAEDVRHLVERSYTIEGLRSSLVRALGNVNELHALARKKGIPVHEPFADETQFMDTSLHILGPSKQYYQELLCDFRETPDRREGAIGTLLTGVRQSVEHAVERVNETFYETLDDHGETSAENNSSVILHLTDSGEQMLFTADAGIPALTMAANKAQSLGFDLTQLRFLQVPHHGSRRNVGPTILNRIKARSAFVSVCRDGAPKHPSRRVMNALTRRGASVFPSRGVHIRHHLNAPPRQGFASLSPEPLLTEFDE
jgi:beta-lactamase superfamily II metal-dependent hydrolase